MVCEAKTHGVPGLPKGGEKNHKKIKMDGLCFVLNALLIVPWVENVSINKSFAVLCVENICR